MKIAVYCSAKDAIPAEYLALGEALGTWIGNQGDTLVYGGATGGLMSQTSEAVRAAGGYVIGVIPPRIIAAGRLAANCNELINVANMAERKLCHYYKNYPLSFPINHQIHEDILHRLNNYLNRH